MDAQWEVTLLLLLLLMLLVESGAIADEATTNGVADANGFVEYEIAAAQQQKEKIQKTMTILLMVCLSIFLKLYRYFCAVTSSFNCVP
jgi:hypothetical protein